MSLLNFIICFKKEIILLKYTNQINLFNLTENHERIQPNQICVATQGPAIESADVFPANFQSRDSQEHQAQIHEKERQQQF